MKRFIGYHFFHGIRRIAPRDAYSKTKHAMSLFTDQKGPSYRAFVLDLRDDQGGALELLYEDLCAKFGPVSNTMKSISVGDVPTFRAHWWNLNAEQFEQAFSILDSVYRDIPLAKDRAKLQASWNFKFIDPDTSLLLPDQEEMPVIDVRLGGGSSLNLTTGGKTSANAWFLFPFESASQNFEHYVSRAQKSDKKEFEQPAGLGSRMTSTAIRFSLSSSTSRLPPIRTFPNVTSKTRRNTIVPLAREPH